MARPRKAVIIGSGPNGLSAGIVLAQAGWSVSVLEAEAQFGGGVRSAELTLPGYIHDVCSAVYPMAVATRFFQSLQLEKYGLEWIYPPLLLAHPFDDGSAAVLERSLEATAARLGASGPTYRRLVHPAVRHWAAIEADVLRELHWPTHWRGLPEFGARALRPATAVARRLHGRDAQALWAGLAAHSIQPLDSPGTSAIALVLAAAGHRAGWPIVLGGAQRLSQALADCLRAAGGEITTGRRIESLDPIPAGTTVVCDLHPRGVLRIFGHALPAAYRRRLERFRPASGVIKMDWALAGPIPWRAPECGQAGTVHLGGSLEEIATYERWACGENATPEPPASPFVLLAQPSLFDPTRAPAGRHTAWGYCHVPWGSTVNMAEAIEDQIERFAPGFRDIVLARSVCGPAELEAHNANLVGGDISGGANSLLQIWRRPSWGAYRTPLPLVYLCSSSTPPGGGVHGLCGYWAAQRVLTDARAQGHG